MRVEIDQLAGFADRSRAPRPATQSPAQRAILSDEQVQMCALLFGELQKDLLAFRVFETLAVSLEKSMRAAFTFDADEERLQIVDAFAEPFGALCKKAARRAFEKQKRRPRFKVLIA